LQLKNSESRKNPGRIPEKQTNLAEQSRKTIGSVGRIPEESRKKQTRPQNNPGRIPEDHCKHVKIKGDTIVMYNKPVAINGKWSILQENKNND
jgi:hypothetical protein